MAPLLLVTLVVASAPTTTTMAMAVNPLPLGVVVRAALIPVPRPGCPHPKPMGRHRPAMATSLHPQHSVWPRITPTVLALQAAGHIQRDAVAALLYTLPQGAPPPQVSPTRHPWRCAYRGAPPPPVYAAPSAPQQSWTPMASSSREQGPLINNFSTMSLTPPPSSAEWYADSVPVPTWPPLLVYSPFFVF